MVSAERRWRRPATVETRMQSSAKSRRGNTAETLKDDHGKLELYSLPDVEPVEVVQYQCDVVKLS